MPRDGGPGPFLWLAASLSLVLPWIAGALIVAGAVALHQGGAHAWFIGLGAVLFVADFAFDYWLAHPSVAGSAEPDLNRRGAQLIGRIVMVEEAVEDGRGKVHVGDTLWTAEGAKAPRGASVRITGVRGTALIVEQVQDNP